MFEGVLTALVTPFRDGEVDESALRALVEMQIEAGIDGLVPCGSTGESATLTHAEHRRVVEIVVQATRGRVPVVAGTGSNNTREAIELTLHAKEAGADGALLISPYYNKPTQEGIVRHFAEIASRTSFPLVPYNIPGRTASNVLPATVARLADLDQVVAIKEACGDLGQISEVIERCPESFNVLSGDDVLTLPVIAVGGKGVISRSGRAGRACALVPRRRHRCVAGLAPAAAPALRCALLRDQPHSSQGGAAPRGVDRPRDPAPAHPAHRAQPRAAPGGFEGSRADRMMR
jgi:4-hydroxy-tetrahydrodipicolinate synthase